MMSLAIPNDLFWVVGGTGGPHGVIIFLVKIRNKSKLISGEQVSMCIVEKGREGSCKGSACHLFG